MIIKKALKSNEIKFLNDSSSLYVSDFRSIGESMDYSIPAMWKYENLLPWIIKNQSVIANQDYKKNLYFNANNIIEINKGSNPKISIFNKIKDMEMKDMGIKKLWVSIPHPEADLLCEKRKIGINYAYKDFLLRNDKFLQKKLLAQISPEWCQIKSMKQLNTLRQSGVTGFVKRRHGSGGYTIFDINETKKNDKFIQLFAKSSHDWYFEQYINGTSFSIQCMKYKDSSDVIIFGFAEQIIRHRRYFSGAHILSLDNMDINIFEQLEIAIVRIKPLLKKYEGFFGLDFIVDANKRVYVLEANIRLTAVTIPTLLVNNIGGVAADYFEDIKVNRVSKDAIILGYDVEEALADVLDINKNDSSLGMKISRSIKVRSSVFQIR